MVYYFVSYAYLNKDHQTPWMYSSVILEDVHPLDWFCSPPTPFAENFISSLLWWKEITEDEAEKAKGIIAHERNALVNACVAAYIEDTGLACAQQLKDAVIAATGKTPEQIYGIDEVTQ